MSKALVCDRCGEIVYGEISPLRMYINEKTNTNPLITSFYIDRSDTYDLCEECVESFNEWFVSGQVIE